VCGGVRRYHAALGVPIETLPIAIPVDLRADDDPAGGNRFAGARLAAPVGVVDPAERMRAIRALVVDAAHEPAIEALGLAAPVLSRLPAALLDAITAGLAGVDVQASNLPGYPEAPYLAGARV